MLELNFSLLSVNKSSFEGATCDLLLSLWSLLCTPCPLCCHWHASIHFNVLLKHHPRLLGNALQVTLCINLFTSRGAWQQDDDSQRSFSWSTGVSSGVSLPTAFSFSSLLLWIGVPALDQEKDRHVLDTLKSKTEERQGLRCHRESPSHTSY